VDENVAFGRLLHRLRKARDLTQEALAQQAYCVVDTIRKIEAGVRRPSRQMAAQFADCLGLAGEERAAFLSSARVATGAKVAPISTTVVGDLLEQIIPPHHRNLPAQTTTLIGREREIAALRELLRHTDARLITLTGPAGVGKTRLALQAAAEALDDFASDACFVVLAPVSDPNLVIPTIAHTLGVREASGQPLLETLIASLREQQLLLVLDNFEQVIDAAPQLARLLAGCPQLTLLMTSRAVLHLYGEHTFVVPPLTLPAVLQLPLAEADRMTILTQSEAVRLFIERAQAARSDFTLTHANAPAVAEICARLDGLPLAIELAAARVAVFTPQELLARLDQRFALLTGAAVDLPTRQQTLRRAIDWSYALLGAGEQVLFRRLGAFVGGCTLDAIGAVCDTADSLEVDVLEGVTALLDKSLLQRTEDTDGRSRFTMLETIREYALERLEQSGEAEMIRQRHAAYFLGLAEMAEPALIGSQQALWLDWLEADHANIRIALVRAIKGVNLDVGLRLVGALWRFWLYRGHITEGRKWLEEMLGRKGGAAVWRAKALNGAGNLAREQSELERSRILHEESLALLQELRDDQAIGRALLNLGVVAQEQGDRERARSLYQEGRTLCVQQGDRWGIAFALTRQASLAIEEGRDKDAQILYQQGLDIWYDLKDMVGFTWVLSSLARLALQQGDTRQAQVYASEAARIASDLHIKSSHAPALWILGNVANKQGDIPYAIELLKQCLALYANLNDEQALAAVQKDLTQLTEA
jgi:predicted ATPase/DNA-binding XRE family transcriptional regulator